MLSVGNVGQKSYNTSFGCNGNAKKLVEQFNKKPLMSPEQFDKIALTDPVAKAAQKLKAGLGSKEELREVIMREDVGNKSFMSKFDKLKEYVRKYGINGTQEASAKMEELEKAGKIVIKDGPASGGIGGNLNLPKPPFAKY